MFHKITIIGNLGYTPELRHTPDGQPVSNFAIAAFRRYRKNGELLEETTWFRITAWGKLAESCVESLKKGDKIFVEGRLLPNEYGNPFVKDGRARYEVRAEEIKFLVFGGEEDE